jgi:hypothetical protein
MMREKEVTMYRSPTIPVAATHRPSVAEYHALLHSGQLAPEDRLELLDGQRVPKMTIPPPHATPEESQAFVDELWGGWGNDTLWASIGRDYLNGEEGYDILWGLSAWNTILVPNPTDRLGMQ